MQKMIDDNNFLLKQSFEEKERLAQEMEKERQELIRKQAKEREQLQQKYAEERRQMLQSGTDHWVPLLLQSSRKGCASKDFVSTIECSPLPRTHRPASVWVCALSHTFRIWQVTGRQAARRGRGAARARRIRRGAAGGARQGGGALPQEGAGAGGRGGGRPGEREGARRRPRHEGAPSARLC